MNGPVRAAVMGAALFVTTAAQAAAPLTSLHLTYKETMTRAKAKPESLASRMWLKRNKMRVEQGDLTVISTGKKTYMFSPKDPQKRMQVQDVPRSQQNANITAYIGQMIGPMLRQMKKVGKGQVNGYPVDIYQKTDPKTKSTRKAWVATSIGVPVFLREENRIPNGLHVVEVTSIKVNPSIPDSLFAPPRGYKEVKTPPMPKGMTPPSPKR